MTNSVTQSQRPPQIGEEQVQLLQQLCEACAISGDEGEVRKIVQEQVRPFLQDEDDLKIDALGNILVSRKGNTPNRLRVMLAAHMDEVGFMLSNDEKDGIFRFETVGGLDARQLVGKPVWVGKDHLPGVIGAKPVHLTKSEERRKAISADELRIDMGPENGNKVKVGDRATFATPFQRLGPSLRAKALDDRLGVCTLIELVKHAPANIDLLAAFTVQEEIGLRGAQVAAYGLDPDLAIVLDSTPAYDLPFLESENEMLRENARYNSRLGFGPAVYVADRATLSDPRLIRHLVASAESAGIPMQFRQPGGGGTDAGVIHKQRAGIPSVSVSIPGRYLHTAAGICRLSDWQNTLALVHAALTTLKVDLLVTER